MIGLLQQAKGLNTDFAASWVDFGGLEVWIDFRGDSILNAHRQ